MVRIRFNRSVNIGSVVKKLVYTILSLYVGGTIVTTFGTVMNCTQSPFYQGLTLIGWTVTSTVTNMSATCGQVVGTTGSATGYNVITSVSGSGVLSVIGIIGIANVVMDFVKF